MNPDFLINGVLSSVLGGGRKRAGRSLRYLNGGGSIWTRPTTLLTAAGVAWGIYETLQHKGSQSPAVGGSSPASPATVSGGGLPPLPGESAAGEDGDALRIVRL